MVRLALGIEIVMQRDLKGLINKGLLVAEGETDRRVYKLTEKGNE